MSTISNAYADGVYAALEKLGGAQRFSMLPVANPAVSVAHHTPGATFNYPPAQPQRGPVALMDAHPTRKVDYEMRLPSRKYPQPYTDDQLAAKR